jgi:hypothetical protein
MLSWPQKTFIQTGRGTRPMTPTNLPDGKVVTLDAGRAKAARR